MHSVTLPSAAHFHSQDFFWECSHGGSEGLSIGYPRCTGWHVPFQDPRSIPFRLPLLVIACSIAEPDGPILSSMSKWCFPLSLVSFRKEHKTSRKGSDLGSRVRGPRPPLAEPENAPRLSCSLKLRGKGCPRPSWPEDHSLLCSRKTTRGPIAGPADGGYRFSTGTKGFGAHRLSLNSSFTIYCRSLHRGHLNRQGISARI